MKGTRFVNVRSLLFLIVLWATINVYAATSQEEREQHDYDDREAAHANPPQLDLAAPETTLLMDRVYIVTDQQRQARRISPYQLLGDDESACGRTGSTTGSSESDRDSSCDYNSDSSATSIGSIGHDFQVPPSIRDGGPYHYISFVQLKHRGSWRDRLRLPDTIVLRRSIRNMHRRRIVTGQHVMRINLHRGMVIENKLEDLEGVVTRARRDEMKALDEKRFHVASFRLRGRAMRDFMGRAGLKTDRSDSGSATMNIHALELRVVYVSFRLDAEVVDKVHPGFDDIMRLRWNNHRTLPMVRRTRVACIISVTNDRLPSS